MSCSDIFLGLIAILFPPIAVWVKSGLCSADSFINLALCCLGYLPGLIHAWYIIARNPSPEIAYEPIDNERGERVTYYYVSPAPPRHYGTQGAPKVNVANKPQQQPPHPGKQVWNGQGVDRTVEGPSEEAVAPPPTYSETVRGDHKVQNP